jgi:sortase A
VIKHRSRLGWINIGLVIAIVVINGYILVLPFLPQVSLWLHKKQISGLAGLPYRTKLDNNANQNRASVPSDNRIIIPKIALDQHIYTGKSQYLVNKGPWARPNTSTPSRGSNTVIAGHRFTYSGPATFYSLDKIMAGDIVVLYWQGKEYDYKVAKTEIVPATAIEIERPTKDSQLTIYTCTPLWSAKDRLVVIAKPIGQKDTP